MIVNSNINKKLIEGTLHQTYSLLGGESIPNYLIEDTVSKLLQQSRSYI